MEKNDILRLLSGLMKKHGTDFSVVIKYMTASGKVRKRSGVFRQLIDDESLVLYNKKKKSEGRYLLDCIKAIGKEAD